MLTMNYTYQIKPTAHQQALMLEWLETCRYLYNRCLRDLKDWIKARKCSLFSCSLNQEYIISPELPFPNYLEQKRQLTQWKKTNPKYKIVHSQVTQDVVKRMHNTWEAFRRRATASLATRSTDNIARLFFRSLRTTQSPPPTSSYRGRPIVPSPRRRGVGRGARSNCLPLGKCQSTYIDKFQKDLRLKLSGLYQGQEEHGGMQS